MFLRPNPLLHKELFYTNCVIHKHNVLHKNRVLAEGLFAAYRIALALVAGGTRRRRLNIWELSHSLPSKSQSFKARTIRSMVSPYPADSLFCSNSWQTSSTYLSRQNWVKRSQKGLKTQSKKVNKKISKKTTRCKSLQAQNTQNCLRIFDGKYARGHVDPAWHGAPADPDLCGRAAWSVGKLCWMQRSHAVNPTISPNVWWLRLKTKP